jgi:hypothetical protein
MGRWAAAMADVAATGGGGLRGRVGKNIKKPPILTAYSK